MSDKSSIVGGSVKERVPERIQERGNRKLRACERPRQAQVAQPRSQDDRMGADEMGKRRMENQGPVGEDIGDAKSSKQKQVR